MDLIVRHRSEKWCLTFRVIEFIACVLCLVLALLLTRETNLTFLVKYPLIFTSIMFTAITVFDLIAYTMNNQIMCITTWFLFGTLAMLFFFLASGILLMQVISISHPTIVIITLIAALITAFIFLLDILSIIGKLESKNMEEEPDVPKPKPQPLRKVSPTTVETPEPIPTEQPPEGRSVQTLPRTCPACVKTGDGERCIAKVLEPEPLIITEKPTFDSRSVQTLPRICPACVKTSDGEKCTAKILFTSRSIQAVNSKLCPCCDMICDNDPNECLRALQQMEMKTETEPQAEIIKPVKIIAPLEEQKWRQTCPPCKETCDHQKCTAKEPEPEPLVLFTSRSIQAVNSELCPCCDMICGNDPNECLRALQQMEIETEIEPQMKIIKPVKIITPLEEQKWPQTCPSCKETCDHQKCTVKEPEPEPEPEPLVLFTSRSIQAVNSKLYPGCNTICDNDPHECLRAHKPTEPQPQVEIMKPIRTIESKPVKAAPKKVMEEKRYRSAESQERRPRTRAKPSGGKSESAKATSRLPQSPLPSSRTYDKEISEPTKIKELIPALQTTSVSIEAFPDMRDKITQMSRTNLPEIKSIDHTKRIQEQISLIPKQETSENLLTERERERKQSKETELAETPILDLSAESLITDENQSPNKNSASEICNCKQSSVQNTLCPHCKPLILQQLTKDSSGPKLRRCSAPSNYTLSEEEERFLHDYTPPKRNGLEPELTLKQRALSPMILEKQTSPLFQFITSNPSSPRTYSQTKIPTFCFKPPTPRYKSIVCQTSTTSKSEPESPKICVCKETMAAQYKYCKMHDDKPKTKSVPGSATQRRSSKK